MMLDVSLAVTVTSPCASTTLIEVEVGVKPLSSPMKALVALEMVLVAFRPAPLRLRPTREPATAVARAKALIVDVSWALRSMFPGFALTSWLASVMYDSITLPTLLFARATEMETLPPKSAKDAATATASTSASISELSCA